MHIEVIEGLDAFKALQANWDAVYAADPEANVFLSWDWLSDWLTHFPTPWFVLAAKVSSTDKDYVAFLPLRVRTHFQPGAGFFNEVYFAGDGYSDYNGLIATPEAEARALPAFAAFLKRRGRWAQLTLENLRMSARRRRTFLSGFDTRQFIHGDREYVDVGTNMDHGICPAVSLPDDWDAYLSTLSANNRQKIRRLMRKMDGGQPYRITIADDATYARDIKTLLDFWRIKWAPSKKDQVDPIILRNSVMLAQCAEKGRLFLPVFWDGDRPVAALATLVDPAKASLLFFITGRDETYQEMPAGYLLHAFSLRHAIEGGYTTYDFLRGNDPYKYLFGPQEHRLRAASVTTRSRQNLGGKLDVCGLGFMLSRTLELEEAGAFADAELGYRQILEVAPDHALALYRFGRLKAKLGDNAEAKTLLTRSVEADADGDNAWLWLGRALQALGELEAARAACRAAARLRPGNDAVAALSLELGQAASPLGAPSAAGARRPPNGEADAGRGWELRQLVSQDPSFAQLDGFRRARTATTAAL